MVSQLLIYQRVRPCANLLWSDLARPAVRDGPEWGHDNLAVRPRSPAEGRAARETESWPCPCVPRPAPPTTRVQDFRRTPRGSSSAWVARQRCGAHLRRQDFAILLKGKGELEQGIRPPYLRLEEQGALLGLHSASHRLLHTRSVPCSSIFAGNRVSHRESARVCCGYPEGGGVRETPRRAGGTFGLTRYYTDTAGVYRRHLPPAQRTGRKAGEAERWSAST